MLTMKLRTALCLLPLLVSGVTTSLMTATPVYAYAEEGTKLLLSDGTPKLDKNGKPVKSGDLSETINVTDHFVSKGGLPNLFAVVFFKASTSQGYTFEIVDKDNKIVDSGPAKMNTEKKFAARMFIINTSGTYTMKAYNDSDRQKPVQMATFTVGVDTKAAK